MLLGVTITSACMGYKKLLVYPPWSAVSRLSARLSFFSTQTVLQKPWPKFFSGTWPASRLIAVFILLPVAVCLYVCLKSL